MNRSRPTKRHGAVTLACAGGLLTAVGFAGAGPLAATASSHREAPRISGTPQYDGTDVEEARAALYPLFGKTYYYDYFLMSNLPQY
jgi:hypothetical protein